MFMAKKKTDDTGEIDLSSQVENALIEEPKVNVEEEESDEDKYDIRTLKLHQIKKLRMSVQSINAFYELCERSPLLDAKKREYNVGDIPSLAEVSPKDLVKVTKDNNFSLTETQATEIIRAASSKVNTPFAIPMEEYITSMAHDRMILRTGSKGWDELLGGGFRTRDSYLLSGEFSTGKSQIAMQACIYSLKDVKEGGLHIPGTPFHHIVWFDTEANTEFFFEPLVVGENDDGSPIFGPTRAEMLCKRFNVDYKIFLKQFIFNRIDSLEDQRNKFLWWVDNIKNYNPKIFVVDSFMNHIRAKFFGRENFPERASVILELIGYLIKIKNRANAIVIATNQVSANPNAQGGPFATADKTQTPTGGNTLKHGFNVFPFMYKAKAGPKKFVKLIDANYLSSTKIICYKITEIGVEDEKMTSKKGADEEIEDAPEIPLD